MHLQYICILILLRELGLPLHTLNFKMSVLNNATTTEAKYVISLLHETFFLILFVTTIVRTLKGHLMEAQRLGFTKFICKTFRVEVIQTGAFCKQESVSSSVKHVM